MSTFQTSISVSLGSMQVAEIPADVAAAWLQTHGKRCLYQLHDGKPYHGGLISNGLGGYFVIINKQARAAAQTQVGSLVTMTLTPDSSEFGCEMPDELAEVLATDPDADMVFRAQTPGRQRGLIYLVTAVKSSDKRIDRALQIVKALQGGQTDPRKILT
jgi:hypothetical protein